MKLVTKELLKKTPRLYTTGDLSTDDVLVHFKLFNPSGSGTWYITEVDEAGDLAFGWCDLGFGCPELGLVSIRELAAYRGPLGLGIERDMWWTPCPLSQVMNMNGGGKW